MGLKNQKFLLLDAVLVQAEIHLPLYLSKSNPKNEQQLGLSRQFQLFKYFIRMVIRQEDWECYYEMLAAYFRYNIFYKKKNGLKRLKHIYTLLNDQELGGYFQRGLKLSLFFKYFKALFRKYFGFSRSYTIGKWIRIFLYISECPRLLQRPCSGIIDFHALFRRCGHWYRRYSSRITGILWITVSCGHFEWEYFDARGLFRYLPCHVQNLGCSKVKGSFPVGENTIGSEESYCVFAIYVCSDSFQ